VNNIPAIGFIGVGTMGEPMALNLAKAGIPLVVWNRSAERCDALVRAGATAASHLDDLFARSETIILMLANEAATDGVLGRGSDAFAKRVVGHRLVAMGTMPPEYSERLAGEVRAAGGRYVEAPVSGSRKPAEAGQLVALLAGEPDDFAAIGPLLAAMCGEVFECGSVPNALRMKLAVNVFLITLVTGLAEATHFATRHNLDLEKLAAILDAGPMASDVSRIKVAKLVRGDFGRQAGISDVLKNSRLVVEAARAARIASPLMDACYSLYRDTEALGFGNDDMVTVIRAFEQQTNHIA
jgi:3-hydroxyisobutyrate dehydrogenase